jgi:hypothetical protein
MKFVRKCLVVVLVFFTVSLAFTRDTDGSSSQKVDFRKVENDMGEAYRNGELNRVIELYREMCCKEPDDKGRRKEEKAFRKAKDEIRGDIYKWVVLSYIALDQPEKADIYLKKFLILRRGEELGAYWRSIRNAAKNKYYVAPRWLVGFKLGPTFTIPQPTNRFTVLKPTGENIGESYQKDYVFNFKHSCGTQLGVIIEYALTKNLSLSLHPALSTLKFQYKNNLKWEYNSDKVSTLSFAHKNQFSYIEIPLILKYQLLNIKSKLKTYIQVGGFYRSLTSAKKLIDISFGDIQFPTVIQNTVINIEEQSRRSNIGFLVGVAAGVGHDASGVRFLIELNYKHQFNNIILEDQRYENAELIYGFYDVFDDIKIGNLELSVKLLLPLSFKVFKR